MVTPRGLAARFAVAVAGGPPLTIVVASRGSGTAFLTRGLVDGTPWLESEFVVGLIVPLGNASRGGVIRAPGDAFAPRCVVTIPASASPTAPASPAAAASPRFTAAAVPFGPIAILEDPALGGIPFLDEVVVLMPTGVATPWRAGRVGTGLVGSGLPGAFGGGAIPGRPPRGISPLGAVATPAVAAAPPARRTTPVPSPFPASLFVASSRSRSVARAPIAPPVGAAIDDGAILKAEVVGGPIRATVGDDVARGEISGGTLCLGKSLVAALLSIRTSLERLRRRRGRSLPGCRRRGRRRGWAGGNRVWLEAQAGDDVGPIAP